MIYNVLLYYNIEIIYDHVGYNILGKKYQNWPIDTPIEYVFLIDTPVEYVFLKT